jgi:hypothetical protein
MGKKLEGVTPRSKIRQALRTLSLRSRERSTALKRASYSCNRCGVKQSRAKGKEVYVCAHHINGIDWEELIDLVYERLLQTPEDYEVLCKSCHEEHHAKEE